MILLQYLLPKGHFNHLILTKHVSYVNVWISWQVQTSYSAFKKWYLGTVLIGCLEDKELSKIWCCQYNV